MQPIMGFGIPFIHLNSIKHQPGFVKVWPRITIGLWPKSLCRFWKVFRITSYCSWKGEAYVQPLGFQSLFMRNLWEVFAFKFPKKNANNVFDAYVSKPDKWNEAIWKRKIIVTIRQCLSGAPPQGLAMDGNDGVVFHIYPLTLSRAPGESASRWIINHLPILTSSHLLLRLDMYYFWDVHFYMFSTVHKKA